MWRLSDLIKWAKQGEPDGKKTWVNDYPNGFIFIVLIVLGLFGVAFAPFLGR
jgi:hypothetical protein